MNFKKSFKIFKFRKITDNLRTNNLPIIFIEKRIKNVISYKYIINYYSYSKIFCYIYNLIIKLLNIIGFKKEPNFSYLNF